MASSKSISIGTWNVDWAYAGNSQQYVQVMAQHPADIWVLTETRDAVSPRDRPHCEHSSVRPRDNLKKWTPDSRWVSIWSRWPIKAIEIEADPTRVVCGQVKVPGSKHVLVYGTVLPWGNDVLYNNWGKKNAAIQSQIEEWERLRATYSDCPLIVAGDFNQAMAKKKPNSSGTLQGTIERGLRDLRMTCVTEPARIADCWQHEVIDHIAVPDEFANQFEFKDAWTKDGSWNRVPILTDHGGIVVCGLFSG